MFVKIERNGLNAYIGKEKEIIRLAKHINIERADTLNSGSNQYKAIFGEGASWEVLPYAQAMALMVSAFNGSKLASVLEGLSDVHRVFLAKGKDGKSLYEKALNTASFDTVDAWFDKKKELYQ